MSTIKAHSVSLIGTVLNCEKEIDVTLDSLLRQDFGCVFQDVVIVDGGSSDATCERIKDWARRYPRIVLIEQGSCTIGEGRNIAIEAAKGDIIFVFDSGCIYCPDYVTLMLRPLYDHPEVEVVGGLTCPVGETEFDRCLAGLYDCELQHRTNPSHRTIVYRRRVWETVGGYPRQVSAAEDTCFNLRWRAMHLKYLFVPQAKVYWRVRPGLREILAMEKRNACGDTMLGQYMGRRIVLLGFYGVLGSAIVAVRSYPWLCVLIVSLVALWIWRRILRKKQFRPVLSVRNLISAIIILLASDLGSVVGMIEGFARGRCKQNDVAI